VTSANSGGLSRETLHSTAKMPFRTLLFDRRQEMPDRRYVLLDKEGRVNYPFGMARSIRSARFMRLSRGGHRKSPCQTRACGDSMPPSAMEGKLQLRKCQEDTSMSEGTSIKKSELTDSQLEDVQGGMMMNPAVKALTAINSSVTQAIQAQSPASLDPSPDDDFDPPVRSWSA
jgi:hypothetical protein